MRFAPLMALAVLASLPPVWAQDEGASPHRMLKADGGVDTEKCAVCHNADMSLARPKAEVCTLCHSTTIHSGAVEHLQANPASVAALIGGKQSEPALPLTENGAIYCGTCHLFHDPRVITGEQPQDRAWVPPATGIAAAVRNGIQKLQPQVAQKYGETGPGATFATKSTRMLRLPVADGSLCRHCHGMQP